MKTARGELWSVVTISIPGGLKDYLEKIADTGYMKKKEPPPLSIRESYMSTMTGWHAAYEAYYDGSDYESGHE